MDLSFLIPSKVRRLVIAYYVDYPDTVAGVRELAREIKVSPQLAYRELTNLESLGLLLSSRRGNQRAYRLNKRFPLYSPLQDLFTKWKEANEDRPTVNRTLSWETLSSQYQKIAVPPELVPGLTSKRTKPRAYLEEKIMKRKGML
jgi:DNA-binding transcriptional ArsR family regulator